MNVEKVFQKIKESGKKYVVMTGNAGWKKIIDKQNGCFFCLKSCKNHNEITELIQRLSDFDTDMIVLCDKCYSSPRMRMENIVDIRKDFTKHGLDNMQIIEV